MVETRLTERAATSRVLPAILAYTVTAIVAHIICVGLPISLVIYRVARL
jgi:hypothetical protein